MLNKKAIRDSLQGQRILQQKEETSTMKNWTNPESDSVFVQFAFYTFTLIHSKVSPKWRYFFLVSTSHHSKQFLLLTWDTLHAHSSIL